jgi:site-specific recombinase XerD
MKLNKQKAPRGVFERPPDSGIWWISYFDDAGKWHREKVGRQSVAIEAYVKRKREIREGRFIAPADRRLPKMLFGDLVDRALAHKKTRVAPGSYRNDVWRFNLRFEGLRSARVCDLTTARLEAELQAIFATGKITGETVNRYRSMLSTFFNFGVRNGLCKDNPIARIPKFRGNDFRVRFLDHAEELTLRKAIRVDWPELEPEFDLALHTGMRRGEQFSLRWENVSLDRGILTVKGKTGRRHIPINSVARAALEKLHPMSNGSEFVCSRTKNDQQKDWRRWFQEATAKAKIANFHWHDLRHTFASRLVMAGVDLASVSNLLGHKSISMTMRYAHLAPDHQKTNVERLVPVVVPVAAAPERRVVKMRKRA